LRTFNREHGNIPKGHVNVVQQAGKAKLMAALLQPIGPVGFLAADSTDICIQHFLLGWLADRLYHVHQIVKSLLHVVGTTL